MLQPIRTLLSCKPAFLFLIFFSANTFSQTPDYAHLVNPFIGTGGHGHTYPGATAPFGMVQLSPDTRIDGSWDGCSGYHYSDSVIYGFSHTHLSGTGCSDYGDVMLMPIMGQPVFDPKKYASAFSHKSEAAHAGFYTVLLEDEKINVALTTTTRVGIHEYSFQKNGLSSIILDLKHRDKLLADTIRIINQHTIEGYRCSEAWARNQGVYFRIEFSKDFSEKIIPTEGEEKGKAAFCFDVKVGEKIYVKVSLSAVDFEGAAKNMATELPGWDFEKTKQEAQKAWNKELSTIEVKGGSTNDQIIFYTALYHTFIQPNIFNDVDGRYLGRDFKIHQTDGDNYYTVFSLWDTYRAAHPLYNLIQPNRNQDFIKTFILHYQHCGRLPMWELWANETDCMIGYHAASVIADAYAKGNRDFDLNMAIEACLASTRYQKFGIPVFHQKNYLSIEDESESVSKTLEYAYDDWCIRQLLWQGILSNNDSLGYYYQNHQDLLPSSIGWQNLFNTESGFMQPRYNGGWYTPFDPREVNNHYTEANSWQYSFYAPHQIEKLISLTGGAPMFEKKLDDLFTTSSKTTGREQADITGLIGQYAHGNEPSHHMAYLYNYIGKPEKTKQRVNQILHEMYRNAPDGLAGNEDCGQMSAWYIFSAMGFYPVCPGSNEYIKGAQPIFDEIKIKGVLLDSLKLNITSYNYSGSPTSAYSSPVIETYKKTFKDSMLVSITGNGNDAPIYFRIDTLPRLLYTQPFFINETCTITANNSVSDGENFIPLISEGYFYKIPHHWQIKIKNPYNKQYSAGGDEGIIDGLRGDLDWRKGGWQGYQSCDFEAVVDLMKVDTVSNVRVGFLQDTRSWILMPKHLTVYYSTDGKRFKKAGMIINHIADTSMENQIHEFAVNFKKIKCRYIKVVACNYGKLPKWHQGYGGDAFIFVDEIIIR